MENYMEIGNDELKGRVKEGDKVYSVELNLYGIVECSKNEKGDKINILVFIKNGDASYLVGIDGRLIKDWIIVND